MLTDKDFFTVDDFSFYDDLAMDITLELNQSLVEAQPSSKTKLDILKSDMQQAPELYVSESLATAVMNLKAKKIN